MLGPSTALPGFRAPPGPGFNPKIHTRCLKKTVRYFRVGHHHFITADKTKKKGRWKKVALSLLEGMRGEKDFVFKCDTFSLNQHLKLNDLIRAHMVMKGCLNVCNKQEYSCGLPEMNYLQCGQY